MVKEKEKNDEKEVEETLDNPLTSIYAAQHPEVMEKAKEYQYLDLN